MFTLRPAVQATLVRIKTLLKNIIIICVKMSKIYNFRKSVVLKLIKIFRLIFYNIINRINILYI